MRFWAHVAAVVAAVAACSTPVGAGSDDVARLLDAYPDHFERIDGNVLVWKDGTRMVIDGGGGQRSHEAMLAAPDLKDMFAVPYPRGAQGLPPAALADPGRARPAALFDKMYGDCRRRGTRLPLVDVVWLPTKWGKTVKATTINGVADKLASVSRELDLLPAKFDAFLLPPAGTYVCRPIAGTSRISTHGYGIAIDLATSMSDYWRWSGGKSEAGRAIAYRNRMPMEIVEVFERHGFIWGGKWYHYDTMHFEYRPELLPAR